MRVAITGSTGLIGSAIAARLSSAGDELLRIGRDPGNDVRADLAVVESLPRGVFAGCEALVHAAGVTDEDFQDVSRANAKAETGAQALLDAALAAGTRRLVYISSAHVYGPLEGLIDEAHREDPRSGYARAHVATEKRFREAARDSRMAVLIARPCAVFGMPSSLAGFARWSLIPFDFPRQALTGRIVLKSPGLQRRNFVGSDALAGFVARWLDEEEPGTTVANAVGADEMSVFDFATLCARISVAELGRECAVERPAAGAGAPAPLEYRTRVAAAPLVGMRLEDHVRGLIRVLSMKDPS